MIRSAWISAGIGLLVVAAATTVWMAVTRDHPAEGAERTAPAKLPHQTGEHSRNDWPPEEVFRRAFWRHPATGDKILHAVRLESAGSDGVSRWVWFISMHPGPELLASLKNPETFGLLPTDTPKPPLPEDITPPGWFPASLKAGGMEVLQNPSQTLTLRYRAEDNLLYASDHGRGFAKGLGGN